MLLTSLLRASTFPSVIWSACSCTRQFAGSPICAARLCPPSTVFRACAQRLLFMRLHGSIPIVRALQKSNLRFSPRSPRGCNSPLNRANSAEWSVWAKGV